MGVEPLALDHTRTRLAYQRLEVHSQVCGSSTRVKPPGDRWRGAQRFWKKARNSAPTEKRASARQIEVAHQSETLYRGVIQPLRTLCNWRDILEHRRASSGLRRYVLK